MATLILSQTRSYVTFAVPRIINALRNPFVRPHCEEVRHNCNPDAPRKGNPYLVSYWFRVQQRTHRINDRRNGLVLRKRADDGGHCRGRDECGTDERQED